jgi:hypothetical protein
MAENKTYTSDIDDSTIDPNTLVILTVTRAAAGESTTVHISEDQLGDMMEESDTLGALILAD